MQDAESFASRTPVASGPVMDDIFIYPATGFKNVDALHHNSTCQEHAHYLVSALAGGNASRAYEKRSGRNTLFQFGDRCYLLLGGNFIFTL
jgi:S-adenosylmethionine:tRNA-ribosyltransferase-isomerase (queuine synthetase)